jgi:hypothetical protein
MRPAGSTPELAYPAPIRFSLSRFERAVAVDELKTLPAKRSEQKLEVWRLHNE